MHLALITGASRGLGRAIALALADRGLSLHLVADATLDELQAVATECAARAPGIRVTHAIVDLSRPDTPAAMVDEAVRLHGRIDVLVNNAGVRVRKPFGEFSAADFDLVMQVNTRAPFLASQAAAAHMRLAGRGRIINIASQLGTVTDANASLYGLSKAAVIYLTRAMAVELAGSGVIVNAVSPGTTATDFILQTVSGERLTSRLAKIPVGRLAQPEEIAGVVAYLATTAPDFLVGHDLVVDGGETSA